MRIKHKHTLVNMTSIFGIITSDASLHQHFQVKAFLDT